MKKKQISRKWIYLDQTNSLRVVRLEVLGQNVLVLIVLVLNSCALHKPILLFHLGKVAVVAIVKSYHHFIYYLRKTLKYVYSELKLGRRIGLTE